MSVFRPSTPGTARKSEGAPGGPAVTGVGPLGALPSQRYSASAPYTAATARSAATALVHMLMEQGVFGPAALAASPA
ncbi:hypothetical protein C1J00_01635, partial [Streptomyces cahuitamycinicus]